MTSDRLKILTTDQVAELQAKAAAHGFSRKLPEGATDRLRPDLFHLAQVSVWDHQRTDGQPMHHRVTVLLGMTGKTARVKTWLDVADEDWAPLPDRDTVLARLREDG